jgi:sn-glycerol 3-phosphate transport system permease protein
MIERTPWLDASAHAMLIGGLVVIGLPLYYAFVAATLPLEEVLVTPMPMWPGTRLAENMMTALTQREFGRQILNSMVIAAGITLGKLSVSMLSAYAITYFRFPFRATAFWAIFITLMMPIEVRITPTYAIAANVLSPFQRVLELLGLQDMPWYEVAMTARFSLLDSYAGLTVPLIASATATFLFRQFFLTVPDELLEAARLDGASPWRFFVDILWPMSRANVIALAIIVFIYGWNQYLWPLLITTDKDMLTAVVGVAKFLPGGSEIEPAWNVVMAASLLVMLPPVLVVVTLQRWFVKGLVDTDR